MAHDFSAETDDEFANTGKAFMDELHTRIAARPTGALKRAANFHADRAHMHLDQIKNLVADDGLIQPFSGGDKTSP